MKKNWALAAGWIAIAGTCAATSGSAKAEDWGDLQKLQDFVSRMSVKTNARDIEASHLMTGNIDGAIKIDSNGNPVYDRNGKPVLMSRPWSSTFWPDMRGSIAWPYAESGNLLNNPISWGVSRSTVADRDDVHNQVLSMAQSDLDNLSPAEKYDLLMGDKNFTFTKTVVARVDQLSDIGMLPALTSTYSGICHGWSPASLELPRPAHSFQLISPLGRMITFYPSDVKALEAFLWANADAQNLVKLQGERCETEPKVDSNGRLVDERCFNTNPAFYHLVLVNQIGLNHHGMIMNRTFKSEVQNQPTFAYSFKYYKVTDSHISTTVGLSLQDAKVARAGYSDPYSHYRSPRGVNLVGVEATVWYGMETDPSHDTTDDASKDNTGNFVIHYDLELDANDEIVGGEWREYQGSPTLFEQLVYKHPGVIWLVPPGVTALSDGDTLEVSNSSWNGNGPVPALLQQAQMAATARNYPANVRGHQIQTLAPQPLAKVVGVLINKAN